MDIRTFELDLKKTNIDPSIAVKWTEKLARTIEVIVRIDFEALATIAKT
jgi:hypothetical protein